MKGIIRCGYSSENNTFPFKVIFEFENRDNINVEMTKEDFMTFILTATNTYFNSEGIKSHFDTNTNH